MLLAILIFELLQNETKYNNLYINAHETQWNT